MSESFGAIDEVESRLAAAGYLADTSIATVVYLADRLGKPLLVEGPAGVGKTELARSLAHVLGLPLVRLQCYEGVDETKALYEWDYRKQLLRIQAAENASWDELSGDIFSEDFLLERPVLKALRSPARSLLLIDEVDKLDMEAEALLLEVLSDWQVSIPEMGTVTAVVEPFVVLTSNNVRELSEALKRRCLYLYLDYPSQEREEEIVRSRVPELEPRLARDVVRHVRAIRDLDLRKAPAISETIDWARTLVHLNTGTLDDDLVARTLSVLLKYETDLALAREKLRLGSA